MKQSFELCLPKRELGKEQRDFRNYQVTHSDRKDLLIQFEVINMRLLIKNLKLRIKNSL